MASNNLQKLTPDELLALANQMKTTIGPGPLNLYGVSAGQIAALASGDTDLGTSITGVVSAKAAYHSAVQNRDTKQGVCLGAIVSIAKSIYANPAVTPAMISALGLQPHSTTRTKVTPSTPTELTATPSPDGNVLLKWNRNGNPSSVNFLIESQTGTGAWTFVQDTGKARVTLGGYVPGVAVSFRVVASKNGLMSAASTTAAIYAAPPSAPALQIAA